ncbi:MAG: ketopantoate reductase family protein [Tagaea sp.]
MRVVFVGAGGVGGYFGGKLAQAGADVALVARGAHLDAIRRQGGLRIESPQGDFLAKVRVSDDASTLGPADLVGLAIKLWDTEGAIRAVAPLMGPATRIVSFQNGVEAPDMLREAFGAPRVLGGTAQIATTISAPGTVKHTGAMARLTLGAFGDPADKTVAEFVSLAKKSGVDAVASPDIARTIWEKFVFLSAFSGVTAVTRLAKGGVWRNPETRAFVRALLAETTELARAEGIALAPDHVDRAYEFVASLPDAMKASMLHDLEKGARLELPWLSGAVVRRSRAQGLAALSHAFVVAALAPYADGRPVAG